MNKILFLDVDGVLNIMSSTYHSHSYTTLGTDPIEPHLANRLEFILERVPDLEIIVSSSWGTKQLIRKLEQMRFKYINRIVGRTPRTKQHRGEQILDWLKVNPECDYTVLEDEIADVCGDKCNIIPKDYVIEVDMDEGLSHINTIETVIRLNKLSKLDGYMCDVNSDNYFKFMDLGYRPNVAVPMTDSIEDFELFFSMWDTMSLDNDNLTMLLEKD